MSSLKTIVFPYFKKMKENSYKVFSLNLEISLKFRKQNYMNEKYDSRPIPI